MTDFSITERRNYVASLELCESDEDIISAVTVAHKITPEPITYNLTNTSSPGYAVTILLIDQNRQIYNVGNTYTAQAGTAFPFFRFATARQVGFTRLSPATNVGVVELAREVGLPTTVSGRTIRVVFPTGGQFDSTAYWKYKVYVKGELLTFGTVLIDREDPEPPDEDEDRESTFEVCTFTAGPA